jgi:hypothetical protein
VVNWGGVEAFSMTMKWIAIRNEDGSVSFPLVHAADWASRDYGTGRVELFKNGRPVGEITLKLSQELITIPFNFSFH